MSSRIYECIEKISETIKANKDLLTDLDREIGDADHGVNMARGFSAVEEKVPKDEADIGVLLRKTGMTLLSTVGGASGPLFGTAFMEAGKAAAGKTELEPQDLAAMFDAAIAGIQKRGKAELGEKTMLDALVPAAEKYKEMIAGGADMAAALDAAVEEAHKGVEYTKTIRATKGRASYLGDRSIGHQDPGATSVTLILETIRDFAKR